MFVVRVDCRREAPQQTRGRRNLRAHLVPPGPVSWSHLPCTSVCITASYTCPVAFPGTLCHCVTPSALESIPQSLNWLSLTLLKLINYYPAPGDVTVSLLGDAFACIQTDGPSHPQERGGCLCAAISVPDGVQVSGEILPKRMDRRRKDFFLNAVGHVPGL